MRIAGFVIPLAVLIAPTVQAADGSLLFTSSGLKVAESVFLSAKAQLKCVGISGVELESQLSSVDPQNVPRTTEVLKFKGCGGEARLSDVMQVSNAGEVQLAIVQPLR